VKKLILVIFLLSAFQSLIIGQSDTFSLEGRVMSGYDRKGIPDAIIYYTKTRGVQTDSLGYFFIKDLSSGEYKLTFSARGYPLVDTTMVFHKSINLKYWFIRFPCDYYNEEKALRDIDSGKIFLLLASGMDPVIYEGDAEFEKEFGVLYFDFSCVAGDYQDCMIEYNKTVFSHLDRKYGNSWRKKIRIDVIGFK
jgi:hypothetical protein